MCGDKGINFLDHFFTKEFCFCFCRDTVSFRDCHAKNERDKQWNLFFFLVH